MEINGCPDFEGYTYQVNTNLPVVEMILPPGCTATSPTTGTCQFAVEVDTYQVTISGVGKTLDLMHCGSDFETITIEGCCEQPPPPADCEFGKPIWDAEACEWNCPPCTSCETTTNVTLTNVLVEDDPSDPATGYRVETTFNMVPPGDYRLLVTQSGNVLRDTTSDIQQGYLTPGNAETPLPCDSPPVEVKFEVLDDKCGEAVARSTGRA